MKKFILLGIVIFGINAYSQVAGDLDPSFGTAGKVFTDLNGGQEDGTAILIQPDGKIILAGSGVVNPADSFDFCAVRYNSDGSLDANFGINGKTNFEITNDNSTNKKDYVIGVVLQSDGKIVILGSSPIANNKRQFSVIRLNSSGSLDTSYATNGILSFGFGTTSCAPTAIAIQPNNKVVVMGIAFTSPTPTSFLDDGAIARINTDGTLDTSFNTDGKLIISYGTDNDTVNAVTIQNDGKILVAGDANGIIALARLTTAGNPDITFGGTLGKVLTDIPSGTEYVNSVLVQSNGKIWCGGTRYVFNTVFNRLLIRFNSNGTLDTTLGDFGYTTGTLSGETGGEIALQNDGKILMLTRISAGTNYFRVTRFTTNGTKDTSFGIAGTSTTSMNTASAHDIDIQADGEIVVGGGNFSGAAADGNFVVARYLSESVLSANNFDSDDLIKIFPNPAKNSLQINLSDTSLIGNSYQILDLMAA